MRIILSIMMVIVGHLAVSQLVLEGTIRDRQSGEELIGANIRISGTSIGTISDHEGRFELELDQIQEGWEILVSYVGYRSEKRVIKGSSYNFRLMEDTTDLAEVVVASEVDKKWRRRLKRFESTFFGESYLGDHCELIDPWGIDLTENDGWLFAETNAPVTWRNTKLGYEVELYLEHFVSQSDRMTYSGDLYFNSLEGDYASIREEAFYGSKKHFFLSLVHGILENEGYKVYRVKYVRSEDRFERRSEINLEEYVSRSADGIELSLDGYYNVIYAQEVDERSNPNAKGFDRNQNSFFILASGSLTVDFRGGVLNPEDFNEYGYWSDVERAAYLLPDEYAPADFERRMWDARLKLEETTNNPVKNGFELSNLLIPAELIMSGGPPRDGIPALDYPDFESASSSNLKADDWVIGVEIADQARAYPLALLNWHELVNDTLNGMGILVSYCPLCGSGVVFESKSLKFGVSGLLYNSDLLMYDRQTESLWSQLMGEAISGPSSGQKLAVVPSRMVRWSEWQSSYPNTTVMSFDTGFDRDYIKDPYEGYLDTPKLFFPVANQSKKLRPKTRVLGVQVGDLFKAYPIAKLPDGETIEDQFGGAKIMIKVAEDGKSAWLTEGDEALATTLFWFAWYAFHPDTEVYK